MSVLEISSAMEASRSGRTQSFYKRIMIVVAQLLLATSFMLAVAPAAAAAPASMNNHISLTPNLALPSCGGETPGFCPNPLAPSQ